MATQIITLSQADLAILKEVVRHYKKNKSGQRPEGTEIGEEGASVWTYVAKTPLVGIPAIDDTGADPVPGSADCDIWQVIPSGGEWVLEVVGEGTVQEKVYNFSGSDVEGDAFIIVQRDAYGVWWAVTAGGGGGGGGTGSTESCAPCSGESIQEGNVSCNGTDNAMLVYLLDSGQIGPGGIQLVNDGACVWVSDEFELACP